MGGATADFGGGRTGTAAGPEGGLGLGKVDGNEPGKSTAGLVGIGDGDGGAGFLS